MNPQSSRWPIILFSIPFAAVLFGIVMISTVNLFPDDVVAGDYYKDGMAINVQLMADRTALELGITADFLLEPSVRISVPGASDSAIQLNVHHVTDERLDRSFLLVPETGSEYSGANELSTILAAPGVWYLELEGLDSQWRLSGRVVTPATDIRLVPNV
jgi:hypothetical protein